MKIVNIDTKELAEPNLKFIERFNSELELCEFSEETKLGLLFSLGLGLSGKILEIFGHDENLFQKKLNILTLYSRGSGDFVDYGELSDTHFTHWIYNANLAIRKILNMDGDINEHLKELPLLSGKSIYIGVTKPEPEFLDEYETGQYNLNVIQNLNDRIFEEFGKELVLKKFTPARAYEAGFAYRMMNTTMDIKGTNYLIGSITKMLSPLYMSFFESPILFSEYLEAFEANHLFSRILHNFHGGGDSPKPEIVTPIHEYHQLLFYKENSYELRDEWLFNKKIDQGSAMMIFHYASKIMESGFVKDVNVFINSGEIYDTSLIGQRCSVNDFLVSVMEVIQKKYGIAGYDEFKQGGGIWNTRWNNKGDYIQYLAILFYETCLHAIVVEEIEF